MNLVMIIVIKNLATNDEGDFPELFNDDLEERVKCFSASQVPPLNNLTI